MLPLHLLTRYKSDDIEPRDPSGALHSEAAASSLSARLLPSEEAAGSDPKKEAAEDAPVAALLEDSGYCSSSASPPADAPVVQDLPEDRYPVSPSSLPVLGMPEDSNCSASPGSLLVERRLDFEESSSAVGELRSPSPPMNTSTLHDLPLLPSASEERHHHQLTRPPLADAGTSPMAPAAPSPSPSPSPGVAFSRFSCSPMHPDEGPTAGAPPFITGRVSTSPPSHCDACTSPLPALGMVCDDLVMAEIAGTASIATSLLGHSDNGTGAGAGAASGRPLTASIATSPLGHTALEPMRDAATEPEEEEEEEEEEGDDGNWLLPEGVGLEQLLLLAEEVLGLKGAQPGQVGGREGGGAGTEGGSARAGGGEGSSGEDLQGSVANTCVYVRSGCGVWGEASI